MDEANYARTGQLSYQYFLVSSTSEWARSHKWDDTYSKQLFADAAQIAALTELTAAWSGCSAWAEPYLSQADQLGLIPGSLRGGDMKKLLVYLRAYRRESILGPLFKLLEAALELLVPLIVASIIDRGIAAGDSGYIARRCLLLAGLGLAGLLASVTAQYFAARAAAGFAGDVRHALYRHIQSLSCAELDQAGPSTLLTRMTLALAPPCSGPLSEPTAPAMAL